MVHVSPKTKVREIYEMSQLKEARLYLMGNGEDFFESSSNGTLQDIMDKHPTWNAHDIAYGLNRLIDIADTKDEYLYQVYSDAEIREEQDKKDVQLFYFPADDKGPFVILLAGGGYGAVASLVEAFPVAAKLNELGIMTFCLNYRVGQ